MANYTLVSSLDLILSVGIHFKVFFLEIGEDSFIKVSRIFIIIIIYLGITYLYSEWT